MDLITDPILRILLRLFGKAGLKEPLETPLGRVQWIARGILLNFRDSFLPKITENKSLIKESHPDFLRVPRAALDEYYRVLDRAALQLKSEVIDPKNKLAAELAIVHQPAGQGSAAAAIWQTDWLRWLAGKGEDGKSPFMQRQSIWTKAVQGGNETAYSALVLVDKERLNDLVGEGAEISGVPFRKALTNFWSEVKQDPTKREELAALKRAIKDVKALIDEKRLDAEEQAGFAASEEEKMRARLIASRKKDEDDE